MAVRHHTPAGLVVHTGDYQVRSDARGRQADRFRQARRVRQTGVLAAVSDCVRVESPGCTPSERAVGQTFDHLFGEAEGRVIVATFASLISRVQQVVDAAVKHGRQVARWAAHGEQRADGDRAWVPDDPNWRPRRCGRAQRHCSPTEMVFIFTGSQGEPTSALTRIANGDHRAAPIVPGDTVIISATPIPATRRQSIGDHQQSLLARART